MIAPEYYVDPSSNSSNIELGTIEHPFKALDDPFREIFAMENTYKMQQKFIIYVKYGSNLTLHSI